jgi:hypothetical protein
MEGSPGKQLGHPHEDQFGYPFGAWVILEKRFVVEETVVESFEDVSQGALELAKIEEHPTLIEYSPAGPGPDLVVVAVKPLAFALVVR